MNRYILRVIYLVSSLFPSICLLFQSLCLLFLSLGPLFLSICLLFLSYFFVLSSFPSNLLSLSSPFFHFPLLNSSLFLFNVLSFPPSLPPSLPLSLPPSLLSCLQVVDVYKSQATARAAKILIENLVLHPMKVRVTCICLSVCQLFSLFVLLPFALYLFCPIFFSLSLSFSL